MMRAARIGHGVALAFFGAALLIGQTEPAGAKSKQSGTAIHQSQKTKHSRTAIHQSHKTASTSKPGGRYSVASHTRSAPRHGSPVATRQVAQTSGPDAAVRNRQAISAMISNRPLVVIDPGHGGRDPGAIGKSGTQEKAVTLAIALELRRVLERTGEYRVAMTRSQDQTVSLSDRLSFARQRDADLLIAIHADASPDRSVRGASVYVSSGQGVRHLAANAGNSSRIAQALSQPDARLRPGSAGLQQSMIEQLADEVKMVVSPARDGHLYVLGSRSIPSVLLETGFISNRQDEALLKQPAHRRLLVEAIKDAIDDYFGGLKAAAPRA